MVDNFFAETEQVAFCTQNIVPGIDFTNDPLLQGRNFSYLDTQLKRLGSPNFTHLPINAPKCPIAHFQQDGHMAMHQPGRPRQLRAELVDRRRARTTRGPRSAGSTSFAAAEAGRQAPAAAGAFADHYSQAGSSTAARRRSSSSTSSTPSSSSCRRSNGPSIRERMVANLRNVDEDLAAGSRRRPRPRAARRRRDRRGRRSRTSLAVAGAEHPRQRAPTFAGRKLGILVTDGADAAVISAVSRRRPKAEGAVRRADRAEHRRRRSLDEDHPARLTRRSTAARRSSTTRWRSSASAGGAASSPLQPPAKDFVTDAHAHCKFVGYTASSQALFQAAGLGELIDGGYVALDAKKATSTNFIKTCRRLRFWDREPAVEA